MKLENSKKRLIVIVGACAAVLLAGTGIFYAVSGGTFDIARIVNSNVEGETRPTETAKPTEPEKPELEASISAQSLDLAENQTAQIKAVLKNKEKSKYNVRYTTSDENIAAIDTKGKITPMSKGECQVGVYVEGYDTTIKNFNVKVEDYRIDQISMLSSYLFGLNTKEAYIYAGNRSGNARITGCKIDDFNGDGNYELFIKYNLANKLQKTFVVTAYGEGYTVHQSEKNFGDIAGGGYLSYIEDVYTDANGNISIIAEATKADANFSEKYTALYSVGGVSEKQAEYYCKEPFNLADMSKKAEYKIDNIKKERDEFTMLYTSLKSSRELFDDYISITAKLSQGNYVKAEFPSNIGQAYYNRLQWVTTDDGVAKVSDSGMITGGSKAGGCEITGFIPGMTVPLCKMTIEASDVTDDFEGYVESIQNSEIMGQAGNRMKLYGYYVTDVDSDGVSDLLLYYVGGNGCQLEAAHYVGSQVSRKVIKSVITENGTSCLLDLYNDSMNGNSLVLYVGKMTKTNSSLTTDFHYETYENGEFTDINSSRYTVISSNSNKNECKVAGETVEESDFNTMLNRYVKLGSWHLV